MLHISDIGVNISPPKIPIVGVRKELLAWPRATFRSIFRSRDWALEGYSKHSTFNIPYLLPTMDRGPMVLLPPKHAKEVYGLPETRLDVWDTINDSIQTRYTIQDQHIMSEALHRDVIRNQITRNLGILTDQLVEELDRGLKYWWGTETQWKRVTAFDSCLNIVAGAANSVFLGPSLCRNELFLHRLKKHATLVFSGGILINITPKPFKHVIGLLVKAVCRYYYNKVLQICLPFVQDRLNRTINWRKGLESEWIPPCDGLQWMIEEAISKCDPVELNARRLSERLLFLNDVSMHTSAFTLQALLENLAASDPHKGYIIAEINVDIVRYYQHGKNGVVFSVTYIETLRHECKTVLDGANGQWTREAVQKLVFLDSTIRESMRVSPFSIFGLPRTVIDSNGISVQNDSSEYFLPYGSIVALPVEHAHFDEEVYKNARSFQPFRSIRPNDDTVPEKAPGTSRIKTAVTLDEHFLAFGHGKHGCPGRFFVIHEIKLMMANILLNYDIEHLESRKELINVMWLKLPLNGLKLRVRRRLLTQKD
ncbi:ent-kaurene oxidase [Xylaria flabelliformis]|nr:ent-kaurene oxidase [Xylaria flabelliformis]